MIVNMRIADLDVAHCIFFIHIVTFTNLTKGAVLLLFDKATYQSALSF